MKMLGKIEGIFNWPEQVWLLQGKDYFVMRSVPVMGEFLLCMVTKGNAIETMRAHKAKGEDTIIIKVEFDTARQIAKDQGKMGICCMVNGRPEVHYVR